MKAFVITLSGNEYSRAVTERCLKSAADIGKIEVEKFIAADSVTGPSWMSAYGLRWTWANNNTSPSVCPITGLKQHPYGKLPAKIGCSMSHYSLWLKCIELNETILVLEHDAVFIRPMPVFEFAGICQINDPAGATPRGKEWSKAIRVTGVSKKTVLFDDRPDGLAGNSAYLIRPQAAADLVAAFHRLGVWPNDAIMCRQLFPYLEQYSPFITRVEQTVSTTSI